MQRWPNDVSYEGRPLATVEILDDVGEHHVVVAYAEHSRLTRRAQSLVAFCTEVLGARASTT